MYKPVAASQHPELVGWDFGQRTKSLLFDSVDDLVRAGVEELGSLFVRLGDGASGGDHGGADAAEAGEERPDLLGLAGRGDDDALGGVRHG